MNHLTATELELFLSDTISAEEATRLSAHVVGCAQCQDHLHRASEIMLEMDDWIVTTGRDARLGTLIVDALRKTAGREGDESLRRKLSGWHNHATGGGSLQRRPHTWHYSFPRPAGRTSGAVRGRSHLRLTAETLEWIQGRDPATITVHDRSEVIVREDASSAAGQQLVILVPVEGSTGEPRAAELKEADEARASAHFPDVPAGEYHVVFEPGSRDDG